MGSRIVKEVVFKPGVKERELWGESQEEGMGEGIGE